MTALAVTKTALTVGWLLAGAALLGAGGAATAAPEPPAAQAAPKAKAHPKVGKQDCAECHGALTGKANVHAAAMDCTQCHEYAEKAGGSGATVRLLNQGAALCSSCHEDTVKAMAGKKVVHAPAADDCTSCHDPHSTDAEKLLKAKPQELCATCHAETGERIASARFVHAPVKDTCAACHNPHASDAAALLKAEPEALCMSCHRYEPKPNPANKTVRRILETSDGKGHPTAGHPYTGAENPAAKGTKITCLTCHDSHGSPVKQLIRDLKPGEDFCGRCH